MTFSIEEETMFHGAVLKNFGDLVNRGFTISSVQRKDRDVTGEKLVVYVEFPDSGRGANIALLRTPDGARRALTTFMHKEDEFGGFMVSTYLKFRGAPSEVSEQLHLSALPGNLSDCVDAVLKSTREAIDRDLLPALIGGAWPAVPVDWGDYK
jgi:hypothetical protein